MLSDPLSVPATAEVIEQPDGGAEGFKEAASGRDGHLAPELAARARMLVASVADVPLVEAESSGDRLERIDASQKLPAPIPPAIDTSTQTGTAVVPAPGVMLDQVADPTQASAGSAANSAVPSQLTEAQEDLTLPVSRTPSVSESMAAALASRLR